jgi:quercetin dioxygenase-like cupin family protein
LIFALCECPDGVEIGDRTHVVYDLERNEAHLGPVRVEGPAVVWLLAASADALVTQCHKGICALEVEVSLDRSAEWVLRCDRVDFPSGGVAYRHVHPGPGIRRILHGELTIDRGDGEPRTYRTGDAWFEGADDPVLATASATEETAFVRVLLLPAEWAGRRTIHYLDPADEDKPRLQRATILLEVEL